MSLKVGKRGATRRSGLRWWVWKAEGGDWYTSIWHTNGRITFDGAQGYSRKIDARRSVQNLIAAIQDGRIEETAGK